MQPSPTAGYGTYEEVPMHQPDARKVPMRSALKGGKTMEIMQRQQEKKLSESGGDYSSSTRVSGKVEESRTQASLQFDP